ncbi:MAG: threonine--tRNA ligase [Candidatus Pacebacteria bacterium]|nr:threonine--tRNA ligase [Candidatus Paceibacterota bacterium]
MKQDINIVRHSLAHVLAIAVKDIFPIVRLGMGPAIENGFYYDFETVGDKQITESDLSKIEERMKEIISSNRFFEKMNISRKEAEEIFQKEPYKLELLSELADDEITVYKTGEFYDLCKGPHINSTEEINADAFKLTKIAGAYWRGSEKNKMLVRIYGYAFETKDELDNHLRMIEEAEKRDHKRLGKEMDLFSFHPEAPGSVYWHEKGVILWDCLEKFGQSIRKKYGYIKIKTPQMAKNGLWVTSGHWEHYKEDMFIFNIDDETYCLKPMDCPFNIQIFQTKQRSYRELPIRYTEIGHVMRNEKSGQLNGLFRVREITQDDSHVFLTEDQIEQEISNLIKMIQEYYNALNVEPKFFLSTRPDDFMGEIATWDKAEEDLKRVLAQNGIENYGLKDKDGAFYGPKIDVNISDALGRSWQVATIQLDFQLPGKFNCEYIDESGERRTPVMLHAAIFGSFERMIGILIEHYAGAFPFWLSPVQIRIIPISENFIDYAKEIEKRLKMFRIEIDTDNQTIGKKIRAAEMEKIPYVLVVGEKEKSNNTVSVRKRGQQDLGEMSIEKFIEQEDLLK